MNKELQEIREMVTFIPGKPTWDRTKVQYRLAIAKLLEIVDTQAEQIRIVEQERDLRNTEKEHLWDEYNKLEKQLANGRALLRSANELLKLVDEKHPDLELEIALQDAWLKEVAG